MIAQQFDYTAPSSLADALPALAAPSSSPIAGGSKLLTRLKRGEASPRTLVDLRGLDELRGIELRGDGRLRIGALTTLTSLVADPTVRAAHLPGALGDAVAATGDVQARNRATVGGTLAAADPGSHLSAALLALDASATIVGQGGERVTTVAALLGGQDALAHGELIRSVDLAPAEPGSAYVNFANRATLQAICGVAVTATLDGSGRLAQCRIAVTGALPAPRRLADVERQLTGSAVPVRMPRLGPLDPGFVDDHDASAEYRAHLTGVLAERAFVTAIDRARRA